MSDVLNHPLPEFTVDSTMQAAASTVAASFHAYQQSCFDLPSAANVKEIQANLLAQKERRQAYHLAMQFLKTAAMKANPGYDMASQPQLSAAQARELSPLLDEYLDRQLNLLIQKEATANPLIRNIAAHHPVISGPW